MKNVLYNVIVLPFSIIAGISAGLATLMLILDRPIRWAFGMQDDYNYWLDNLVDLLDDLRDALKFD